MCSAAVGALGLHPTRGGVAVAAEDSRINAGGGGTRAGRACVGSVLRLYREIRTTAGGIAPSSRARAKLGRGDSLGRGFLDGLGNRKRGHNRFVVIAGG